MDSNDLFTQYFDEFDTINENNINTQTPLSLSKYPATTVNDNVVNKYFDNDIDSIENKNIIQLSATDNDGDSVLRYFQDSTPTTTINTDSINYHQSLPQISKGEETSVKPIPVESNPIDYNPLSSKVANEELKGILPTVETVSQADINATYNTPRIIEKYQQSSDALYTTSRGFIETDLVDTSLWENTIDTDKSPESNYDIVISPEETVSVNALHDDTTATTADDINYLNESYSIPKDSSNKSTITVSNSIVSVPYVKSLNDEISQNSYPDEYIKKQQFPILDDQMPLSKQLNVSKDTVKISQRIEKLIKDEEEVYSNITRSFNRLDTMFRSILCNIADTQ